MTGKQRQIVRVAISVLVYALARPVGAGTLLFPFSIGMHSEFSQSDGVGGTWTEVFNVDKQVSFNSVDYFRIRVSNDENRAVETVYARSTEDAVYKYNPGGAERLSFQKAPVGTRWSYAEEHDEYHYKVIEISAIEPVTVPYGAFDVAYVHRSYRCVDPEHLELGKSAYYYQWIVPGVGIVKTVDNWAAHPPLTGVLVKLTGVPVSFTYDPVDALHIWDLSSTYGEEWSSGYTVTQDAQGRLSGSGDMTFTDWGASIEAHYTVTGSVTQSASVGRVRVTLKLKGTASKDGETSKYSATEIFVGEVNPETGMLTGTAKWSDRLFGERHASTDDVELEVDDGAFSLTVNVEPNGKRATATAMLTLSGHETPYNFSGKGTFNAKRDQYVLTLKSPEKLSLKLYITASTGEITKLTGKALGQNLRATNIPATP